MRLRLPLPPSLGPDMQGTLVNHFSGAKKCLESGNALACSRSSSGLHSGEQQVQKEHVLSVDARKFAYIAFSEGHVFLQHVP